VAQVILHPQAGRSARDYALLYIGLGWKVFPVWNVVDGGLEHDGRWVCACGLGGACDRPGKHPIADLAPGGLNDASSERGDIERWWGARPDASIGVATGRASGLTVIDADASEGKPGVVNLTRICAENGGVPATFVVNTGGGGLHLYFKYSDALPTGNNVLAEAIDVRNDGGYVIAPPSSHASGGSYKWRQDAAELLDLPAWLRSARQAAEGAGGVRRGRGRPRTRAAMRVEKVEALLQHISPDDRDVWLKVGLVLGRMYVGTPGENEGWAAYEAWSARSEKFDEHRAENLQRMREMFSERSQEAPRAGAEPIGPGTLVALAREGGWTPFGARVAVGYEPGNEALMCEQMIAALTADPERNRFFNVMGEVRDVLRTTVASVHVIQHAASLGRAAPECLQVRRTSVSGLQCALSEVAVLATVSRTGEPTAKPIPESLVAMMLKDRARDFPTLSGIAEWPMVSIGGDLLYRQRGYDSATGLYFDIDPSVRIDEQMTAERGWAFMRDELLIDFPFEDEHHRAGALAMLLAFMQRPLMKTCPAFAVIAPQPGTGKSTLIEVASLAVHGQQIAPHAFSNEDEELRKALHSLMLSKLPAVLFDNIGRGKAVASDHLAKLITSETSADRTLGSSETKKEVNSLLLTFTGNNIAFVRDMASRVVSIKLNARVANPIGRVFRHPNIKIYAREKRNEALSALVAIAKLADGSRTGRVSRFEDYDAMIVKPVLEVTGLDVRDLDVVVDVEAEEDETTKDVMRAVHTWQQQFRGERNGQGWRASELVASLAERGMSDESIALIKRWSGAQRWEQDASRALGYALRAVKDDYKFSPYLLVARPERDGVRWIIKGPSEVAVPASQERPF
jgi:hypothetical protein